MSGRVLVAVLLTGWCASVVNLAAQTENPAQGISSPDFDVRVAVAQNGAESKARVQAKSTAHDGFKVSVTQLRIPEQARDALQKAVDATDENNAAAAVPYLTKALTLYPRYAEALSLRAMLERDGDGKQALVDAENAVQYEPNYAPGYLALGSVYNVLNRFDDAIRTLDRAIAMMPVAWQGYYEMSRALVAKREYAAALRQVEIACSLAPEIYPLFHLLKADAFLGLRNNSAAAAELEAYLRAEPNGLRALEAERMLHELQRALP